MAAEFCFSLQEDCFSGNEGRISLQEGCFSPYEDCFSPREDRFSLQQDRFSPDEDGFSSPEDRFSRVRHNSTVAELCISPGKDCMNRHEGRFSGTDHYTAAGGERFLTVGNFRDSVTTDYKKISQPGVPLLLIIMSMASVPSMSAISLHRRMYSPRIPTESTMISGLPAYRTRKRSRS